MVLISVILTILISLMSPTIFFKKGNFILLSCRLHLLLRLFGLLVGVPFFGSRFHVAMGKQTKARDSCGTCFFYIDSFPLLILFQTNNQKTCGQHPINFEKSYSGIYYKLQSLR